MLNLFNAQTTLDSKAGKLKYFSLHALAKAGFAGVETLPYSIKVLLESCLRNLDNFQVSEQDVANLANWKADAVPSTEVPFKPARVLLQDFTGVPATVDLAAMRSAMKRAGGNANRINPLIPVDLVIDHSVQVDFFGQDQAEHRNVDMEFERNGERYEFLKWAQQSFNNFRVVPPANGICHQVNLEYLARVIMVRDGVAFPDSLVGTDSHTTMINGLGIVGWGVGGIEAEACMLGQPISLLAPQVVGFKLTGQLPEGATATDLVLTITQILRKHGVVEKFVEYFGDGLDSMSVSDRATIANMSPEYGATIGLFPIDEMTLAYLRLTGRDEETIDLVERYCKENWLWRQRSTNQRFSQTLELDLSTVQSCVAGPKRPQDRVNLPEVKQNFETVLTDQFKKHPVPMDGQKQLTHGSVVIAAITSCTNTSNPSVMLAAGLMAKKAVEKGLKVPSYVKTSLSPGSRTVTDYYEKAGLSVYLNQLGFQNTGFGCMTCIGNSGPLPEDVAKSVESNDLVAVAVLSGNRNFEGRVNPLVKANYLASPPLVVAYALAGSIDMDLAHDPLGTNDKGEKVYLKDIWPTQKEIADTVTKAVDPAMFRKQYSNVTTSNVKWNAIKVAGGELFDWQADSTYIQEPPFFAKLSECQSKVGTLKGARVLVMVGDSVTTDHISPAGNIKKNSPAGQYLMDHGVAPSDFNQYGARRGNDRVMTRGTFANIRLRNLLAPGTEGGVTRYLPTGEQMSIYDASVKYLANNTCLMVLAGKDYGMGSSRDWAAKGTYLLGVKAVLAESYERIHRSNLVGMGVLPLQYHEGETRTSLNLSGEEIFDVLVPEDLKPKQDVMVIARSADGKTKKEFRVSCRVDTPVEMEYYRNGGILQTVLKNMIAS
jgi:aconitate hydratase A / 2-methylisocitrate dehydratase